MVKYGVDMGNPYAFNLARLVPASLVLLFAVARTPALRKFEWRDTWSVFVLGVAGHVVFQVGFIHGTHASSATSSALILALTACGGTRVSAESGQFSRWGRGARLTRRVREEYPVYFDRNAT